VGGIWEGSGCAPDGLLHVMRGDHIGTLFHKDSYLWVDVKETGARDMAVSARDASRRLQVFLQFPKYASLLLQPFYLSTGGV